ncbi:Protein QmcA (possibly involved in integral membrane quality control) [uncultured Gammaproteobacteria bacterium]|jgi:regulator of protease activity HflC (stomatin/prohibitin superfamily)|nr:Protein QmcA (possibly involved in integral membrane quality control) [uncultured Gammaproteobacteria bacterium]CAC9564132.1 Protein QmcA (possibly involved in integral membrane quality control) [uncultured Gammaproteobacteria bacterium]CAC9569540.1 Protein QmcA (possibly involved in integral membrane quality control) [uncultured Gammaproteobacteria bacterium]CAC9572009.1 Protein QmcA (possibly involved in integral membrane quality control) [uncultured Gammaproteobacteria bacterium]CAC958398
MTDFQIFSIVLATLVVFFILKSIKIVSQSNIYIIERLGKFNRELSAGFHVVIPFLDVVRERITIREQIIDIPSQSVITKDNVNITVDGLVFCKIQNAKEAIYNVVSFHRAISSLAMTTIRSEIGSMQLDETLSNRESLNAKLQLELSDAANNWGLLVTRVEISDISVPNDIEEAMNMQMKAEREKRSIELNAQAEKEAVIRQAEAVKQSEFLKAEAIERMADAKKYEQEKIAEGQQKAITIINEAIAKNQNSAEFLLAKDRIKAFNALASSNSKDKIVVPYEATELIGSLSIFKDILQK